MRTVAISVIVLASVLTALAQTTPPDIADLKTKAAAGDVRAQVALGHAYEDGTGVPQNDEQAAKWYRAAADHGDAQAQNDLGVMYRLGHGVDKDFAEAIKWYRKGAKQGYAPAMFNIGTAYYNGDGVAIDDRLAYAWFAAAREAGSSAAMDAVPRMESELSPSKLAEGKLILLMMLARGQDVPGKPESLKEFQRLADENHPAIQVTLAKMYVVGEGVQKDAAKAEQYCQKAAKADFSPALVCLGYLRQAGLLGSGRENESKKLFERAAKKGNAIAMYSLGVMYANGLGGKPDFVQAGMWLMLASRGGANTNSPVSRVVADKLGPEGMKEAQSAAEKKRFSVHMLNSEDLLFPLVARVGQTD